MNVDEVTLRRIMREEMNQAMDTRFADFEFSINTRFDDLETKLAKFFGDTHHYFNKRFDKFEKRFDKKFGGLQTSVDGIVKRLDADDVERAAMNNQLDRHGTNIVELAKHTGASITGP